MILRTNFASPSKFNLDRSLNRRLVELAELSAKCRSHYPDIRLVLLANEGCLFRCPYKFSHDAHISLAHTGTCPNLTYELNRVLGCIRILSDHPEEILRSPFIRPEDQKYYADLVDVIKICGRTLGPDFLKNAITAYGTGKHEGNLLALLDTQDWQVDRLILANADFPENFFKRLTACDNNCGACGYCRELFHRLSRFQPLVLRDFRTPDPAE